MSNIIPGYPSLQLHGERGRQAISLLLNALWSPYYIPHGEPAPHNADFSNFFCNAVSREFEKHPSRYPALVMWDVKAVIRPFIQKCINEMQQVHAVRLIRGLDGRTLRTALCEISRQQLIPFDLGYAYPAFARLFFITLIDHAAACLAEGV